VDVYALHLIKDYPLVGSGAGSFYGVFPRYGGADVSYGYWDRAHNEYFEILGDYGFIGIALLGSVVALALGSALIAQRKRNSSLMQGMGFAATMGITAMLIHAAVEFNLHIPAYAGTFMVLLAIAEISRHVDLRNA
jgi:O-antigen ligase